MHATPLALFSIVHVPEKLPNDAHTPMLQSESNELQSSGVPAMQVPFAQASVVQPSSSALHGKPFTTGDHSDCVIEGVHISQVFSGFTVPAK